MSANGRLLVRRAHGNRCKLAMALGMALVVAPIPAAAQNPGTWDGAVATGTDDAEQLGSGGIRLTNADLELVVKGGDVQQVGLRFTNVQIPANASIESAYVQFGANGVSTGPVLLTIKAQDSANPPTFAFGAGNISNRPIGNQAVSWSPADWTIDNEAGLAQQAVVTTLVQEAVLRSGWAPGNAIVLIFTGSGTRVANAIDGGVATELHVVYSTGGPPPNQPPLANAGPDQQVTVALPASATLTGSGTDPENGPLTYAWTQPPGQNATIGNPSLATTTVADLLAFGTYTFDLTVTDAGGMSDTDQLVVTAVDSSGPVTIEVPVATGADDGEEKVTGRVTLTNGDLDLVLDTIDPMVVGLRFTGIDIPAGATITSAYIQFRADETQGDPVSLLIEGHAVADAPALAAVKFNITSRPGTIAVVWDPPGWMFGLFGAAQQTPDLTPIISELQGLGWTPGKAMVFIIYGSGKRTADSVEGGFGPRLVIRYAP